MLERPDQFVDANNRAEDRRKASILQWGVGRIVAMGWLFIAAVLLPTSLAIVYFGLIASDVYVSESRFVVRSPEKHSSSGLDFLLKGASFSNAGDEVYAAQDYIVSRDALRAINRDGIFARLYGADAISWFDRFGSSLTGAAFEDLYKYYRTKIKVEHETSSSITTLTVRAFTPGAARRFNEQLLELAESTVNRLNQRGRSDLIRFATTEVKNAKGDARDAALALSAYRNREGLLDPEKQAAVQLQMISKLQDGLITAKGQLVQLRSFTPQNPQIPVVEKRIEALSQEIDHQIGEVAGDRKSLSSAAVQFQRLSLESQFADKQLASAMASLEEARNEARRQQAYVERIVQPNLPDDALEPRRLRGVLATLALGLVAWGVLSMLMAGMLEHQD